MTADIVIGCDSGTRAVKVVAMTLSGMLVASAVEPHPDVRSTVDGGTEQDAIRLRRALERALARVVRAVGMRRVAAIALTTQRDCVVALHERTPVRPMFSWMDRRVLDAALVTRSFKAPRLARLFTHSRARWLMHREPHLAGRVTHWSSLSGYFHLHLCDRLADSSASLPTTFPIDRWKPGWSTDAAEWNAAGMLPASAPSVVDAGAEIGTVGRRASRRTGIAPGTPVIATGGDKNCEVLGGAALDPSSAVLSLGTALSVGTMTGDPSRYRDAPLWTTAAPVAGRWTVEAGVPGGLWTLDWLRRRFPLPSGSRSPEPPTRDGLTVVPYWLGHVSSRAARGVIAGLAATHDGLDVQVAAMEGLAFEARRAVEAIERATGERIGNVTLVGGGSANQTLCRIVAAAIDRRVRVAIDPFAGARGAAAVASLSVRPGTLDRARRFSAPTTVVRVDARWRHRYAQMYEQQYRPLADAALSGGRP